MRYPAYLDYPPRRRRLLVATCVPAAGLLAALALGQLPWATVPAAIASPSKRTVIAERATEYPAASDDDSGGSDDSGDSGDSDSGSSGGGVPDAEGGRSGEEKGSDSEDTDSDNTDTGGTGSDSGSRASGQDGAGAPAAIPLPNLPAGAASTGEGPQVTPGVGGGRQAGGAASPGIDTSAVPRVPIPPGSAAAVPDPAASSPSRDDKSTRRRDSEDTDSEDKGSSTAEGTKETGPRAPAEGSSAPAASASPGGLAGAPPAPEVSLPAPGGVARSSSPAPAGDRAGVVPDGASVVCSRRVSIAELTQAAASAAPNEVLCVDPVQRGRAPAASPPSTSSPTPAPGRLPPLSVPQPSSGTTRQVPSALVPTGSSGGGAQVGTGSPSAATSTDAAGGRWTIRIPWLAGMGCLTMPNSQADGGQGPKEITVCGSDGTSSVPASKSETEAGPARSSGDRGGER